MKTSNAEHSAVMMDSEAPLFMLYTSGSTGKPKGVLHSTAGYMLYAATTFKYSFDVQLDDVYWCTADIGWITGHSYVTYGPLLNAATSVLFEGTPFYPDHKRCWQIIAEHRVSKFYTAPTAIRSLMKFGQEQVEGLTSPASRFLALWVNQSTQKLGNGTTRLLEVLNAASPTLTGRRRQEDTSSHLCPAAPLRNLARHASLSLGLYPISWMRKGKR